MNREKHLETILVLVIALLVFYWIYREKSPGVSYYLFLAAMIIGAIGIFIPALAEKIHWLWMKLAHIMGAVMSKVLLSAIYFIFVLPLSFLSRTLGKKNGIRLKKQADTYFVTRDQVYTKESMENVW